MKIRSLFLSWLIASLGLIHVSTFAHAETPPTLIICEVGWAGSSLSSSDEYLELINLSDEPISLEGIVIEGAATSGEALSLPAMSIEGGATYLITNFASDDARTVIYSEPSFVTSRLALSNSALHLVVRTANDVVLDEVGDGSAPFAGTSNPVASMERTDPSLKGTEADAWFTSSTQMGLRSDVSDQGSPGTCSHAITDTSVEHNEPLESSVSSEPSTHLSDETDAVLSPPPDDPPPDASTSELEHTEEDIDEHETDSVVVTEPASPLVSPVSAPIIVYPPGTLRISEFVSAPASGETEYVEIYNPYNNVIPLEGWVIQEGSGKRTSLPDQLLGYQQYVVVRSIAGNLNNTGDTVSLLDPRGQVIDTLVYGTDEIPAPKSARAMALDADGIFRSTPLLTPGWMNQFPPPEPEPEPEPEPVADAPIKQPTSFTTAKEPLTLASSASSLVQAPSSFESEPVSPVFVHPIAHTLRLSELYANTAGSDATDEFIELYNPSEHDVALEGWTLEDTSGKQFVVRESLVVRAGGYLSLQRMDTRIALNNDRDEIILRAPDAVEIDRISYTHTQRGFSYALVGEVWSEHGTPTPDEPNVVVPETPVVRTARTRSSSVPAQQHIARALEADDQTRVHVVGVVTALPSTLGKQYVAITDASASMLLFKQDGAFPQLLLGDRVRVIGTISTSRSERRVLINGQATLTVLEHTPDSTQTQSYTPDLPAGTMITMAGLFTKEGSSMFVGADDTRVAVRFPATVTPPELGSRVELVGTVRHTTMDDRIDVISSTTTQPSSISSNLVSSSSDTIHMSIGLILTMILLFVVTGFWIARALIPFLRSYGNPASVHPSAQTSH